MGSRRQPRKIHEANDRPIRGLALCINDGESPPGNCGGRPSVIDRLNLYVALTRSRSARRVSVAPVAHDPAALLPMRPDRYPHGGNRAKR